MSERIHVPRIIHAIHIARDLGACREKYLNLLGGLIFAEGYFEAEDRDMALLYAGDFMIEPMSPRDPERTDKSIAKFTKTYGECFHSFEIKVEDGPAASAAMKAAGRRVVADYGNFFFAPASSTGGVLLEVCALAMPNDPYERGNWRPDVMRGHGSTLLRLDHIACVVPEIEPALDFFTRVIDGELLEDAHITAPQPARRILIRIGDTNVAFLAPESSAGVLSTFLEPPCAGIYALVWQVADDKAAEAFFNKNNARTTREGCVSSGFAINPEDFVGARHEFIRGAP
jgi:catechol 2,3-dioxygenase-like lactoylglutathione lyase family enzyme